jgi:translation initiation factor 1
MSRSRLVYSSDPEENKRVRKKGQKKKPSPKPKAPAGGGVRVMRSRKGRGGKTVTLVTGVQHCPQALEDLARELKQVCGCGGSVKNGEIMIQGDHRDKIVEALKAKGISAKAAGG